MSLALSQLALTFAAPTAAPPAYYYVFPKHDCPFHDVSPQPACGAKSKGNLDGLKACCAATPGCGGFNLNGYIKTTGCASNISSTDFATDLYVVQNGPTVWPSPQSYTTGTGRHIIDASKFAFKLAGNSAASPLLAAAFERYQSIVFPHVPGAVDVAACPPPPPSPPPLPITTFELTVDDLDESHPQLGTDESYTLAASSSSPSTLTATAKTVYGALRALETFAQSVGFDAGCQKYSLPSELVVTDAPRFAHRGLMIDTARHYQTLASIRHVIDSLPVAKLNVLHWHMVDTQSFPFRSTSTPALSHGSYAQAGQYPQQYSHGDVAAIVEYARLRGVRVIVEFDMPGHAQSWCYGVPDICPSPTCTTPLNVANDKTFDVITGLLNECTGGAKSAKGQPMGLFPDDFLHLGGDEVNTDCWTKTPSISSWLSSHNLTADGGYAEFVKRAASIAIAQGRRPVQWSEVYDHFKDTLPKETVVHVWKDVTNVTEVLAGGYDVLRNVGYDKTSWYLDNLDVTWKQVYANEPCHDVPDALCPKILGGHGEMWGETVDTSDIEQTIWPKLAAIAEKLWSPRAATVDADAAYPRMVNFRCVLNERGIAAPPAENADARSAPAGPGSCYSFYDH